MSQLPSLAKLSLACRPCAMPFDRWGDVADATEVRQHPRAVQIRATTTCLICQLDIDEKATLGPDPDTRDVEVLVELPCGHAFHTSCLAGVVRAGQARCPGYDRDFIPQTIINRLGGTAVSGQEAALGPYDPNSGLDYNDNPPILTGNDGQPIDPGDEAVYNYPDDRSDAGPNPDDDENALDNDMATIYNGMNDLIRSWGRWRAPSTQWADARRLFRSFWEAHYMDIVDYGSAYDLIVEVRALILREAGATSPRIRGWTVERTARMQLYVELADTLWAYYYENAPPPSPEGGWRFLGLPDEPLLADPTLGVEWVGFIRRYHEFTYNDQITIGRLGLALYEMRAVLRDDEGLYEPMPPWVQAIAQEALNVLSPIMDIAGSIAAQQINPRLDNATYVDAFARLLAIYERVYNPTGTYANTPPAPDWVIEWFQVVMKKFHLAIIDVRMEYEAQSIGVVRGGASRDAVRVYTYHRRTGGTPEPSPSPPGGHTDFEESEDDEPPSPVYNLDGPGWLIPPRN